jgi:hypothetical protein
MRFAILKKWFRRRRDDGRSKEDHRLSASPKSDKPIERAVPVAVMAKPATMPLATRKRAASKIRKRVRPSALGPSSANSIASRPLSRQGIPLLKPDEDLTTHFQEAVVADEPYRDQPPVPAGVANKRQTAPSPASRDATAKRRRNRAGIRLLDSDTDLQEYFMPARDNASVKNQTAPRPKANPGRGTRGARADLPTDRHGIPRLDDQTDLQRLFDLAAGETENAEALGKALHRSLDYDARGLLRQKKGGSFPPRRLSLKEKLRRYPSPQAQLDLHGATAAQARQRAAHFMRSSLANGLFTVRIIVGKGLHSEGGAVLPDVIEDLLLVLKREALVLSYRWDKGIKRKSGAVIVYLSTDLS